MINFYLRVRGPITAWFSVVTKQKPIVYSLHHSLKPIQLKPTHLNRLSGGRGEVLTPKVCVACFVKQQKRGIVLGRGTAHAKHMLAKTPTNVHYGLLVQTCTSLQLTL